MKVIRLESIILLSATTRARGPRAFGQNNNLKFILYKNGVMGNAKFTLIRHTLLPIGC